MSDPAIGYAYDGFLQTYSLSQAMETYLNNNPDRADRPTCPSCARAARYQDETVSDRRAFRGKPAPKMFLAIACRYCKTVSIIIPEPLDYPQYTEIVDVEWAKRYRAHKDKYGAGAMMDNPIRGQWLRKGGAEFILPIKGEK